MVNSRNPLDEKAKEILRLRVREARARIGWNQVQLATYIGATQRVVARVETLQPASAAMVKKLNAFCERVELGELNAQSSPDKNPDIDVSGSVQPPTQPEKPNG